MIKDLATVSNKSTDWPIVQGVLIRTDCEMTREKPLDTIN